ncbi:zinc finger protein 346-like isoform X2 [Tigriopus californicus]|uniref:zinc finger protein 346-like isoform X2 n=1 Tax=Tigriopus californicus TaxID=6832 RepID=UPI0027DA64D6|nr:zinc finger protein 346-like isoform X2 [Tigriopus californicus]
MQRNMEKHSKDDPLFCQLCHVRTNSFKLLSAHLSGKIHIRKLRDRALLHQIALRARQKAKGKAATPGNGLGSTAQAVLVSQQPLEQQSSSSNDLLFCSTCSLKLNSAEQLQSHLQGSKHAKKAANPRQQLSPSGCGPPLPNCIVSHENGHSNVGFKCKTCNLTLNSVPQVVSHLSSDRHLMESTDHPPVKQAKALSSYNPSGAGLGAKLRQPKTADMQMWQTKPPDSTALSFVKGGQL